MLLSTVLQASTRRRRGGEAALEQLVRHIEAAPDLLDSGTGLVLALDLQSRVVGSLAASQVRTGPEGGLAVAERLRVLCESVVAVVATPDQSIRLEVSTVGTCTDVVADTVLRVAHEFVCNAITHGMHERVVGRIAVRLVTTRDRTVLTVSDDGWGFHAEVQDGQGLQIARAFAARHRGSVALRRGIETTAVLTLMTAP